MKNLDKKVIDRLIFNMVINAMCFFSLTVLIVTWP